MADDFDAMAAEIVAMHDATDDVSECGRACHWHSVYGWVPEADCPEHDAPDKSTLLIQREDNANG